MPNFLHPGLLGPYFATVLVAVSIPIIIHLINMLRHRRVEWAAMEFLLASHKKNRTWVRMKQLLLLLLRMAAMAAIAFMVAQPLLGSRLGGLFGAVNTHHILLLDDSFSMSDRWADTSAFDEAKKVVLRMGVQAAERAEPQTMTLLRFTHAGRIDRETQPDLLNEN
ncbi:MAG: BatA domain-containing protein, partial [Planctomycetota bacterium]